MAKKREWSATQRANFSATMAAKRIKRQRAASTKRARRRTPAPDSALDIIEARDRGEIVTLGDDGAVTVRVGKVTITIQK